MNLNRDQEKNALFRLPIDTTAVSPTPHFQPIKNGEKCSKIAGLISSPPLLEPCNIIMLSLQETHGLDRENNLESPFSNDPVKSRDSL